MTGLEGVRPLNKVFILVALAAFVVGGLASLPASHVQVTPPNPVATSYANNITQNITPVDPHNLNVQVYGNTSSQKGFPAYVLPSAPREEMPQALFIVFRAPSTPEANSTVTISLNGSYVVQNLQFYDKGNFSFTTSLTGNVPMVITLHSPEMNYTKVVRYTLEIETLTTFVKYYQNKVNHKTTNNPTQRQAFVIFGIPAGMGVFFGITTAIYWRWQTNTNPDVDRMRVGGAGGRRSLQ